MEEKFERVNNHCDLYPFSIIKYMGWQSGFSAPRNLDKTVIGYFCIVCTPKEIVFSTANKFN